MKSFTRRDMLKTSLLAPAVAAATHGITPIEAAMRVAGESAGPLPPAGPLQSDAAPSSAQTGAGREHLLLDFGWRFHLDDACNPASDFGLGIGRTGNLQKTGDCQETHQSLVVSPISTTSTRAQFIQVLPKPFRR